MRRNAALIFKLEVRTETHFILCASVRICSTV